MASLIFHVVEKAAPPTTDAKFPVPSSAFLVFPSIGCPKSNQPLRTIPQTPKSTPYICPPKLSNASDPSYKILASKSPILLLPYPIYEYSQPKIDIIKSNHLTSWVNNIDVYIHYSHGQYDLLTVYPDKLKPPFVQKI